ncbi:hypothetical protein WMW72_17140 [Paenibacillus filicis]|uniref:Uncharacterized protein n=1 Tax=Paenibacillus filicis TaxID=669464 RepID=A0ABU9DLA8_9BACL
MGIVFTEYKIDAIHRTDYLTWAADLKQEFAELEIYEGTEQPNLFVEIWSGLSQEKYAALKAARIGEDSRIAQDEESGRWRTMELWVAGGRPKIHMWQFSPISGKGV